MNNSNSYITFYEKDISPTQKIVVHLVSFNKKLPALACQHMWRNNDKEEWKYGKMAVMKKDVIKLMIDGDVLKKAIEKIEEIEHA